MAKDANSSDPKKMTSWKLSKSVLEDLAKVAALENRSVTNCAETIIKNYCKNKLVGVKHHGPG